MRRRDVIVGAGMALLWCMAARALAQGKQPVIGILALFASESDKVFVNTFVKALERLGYVAGKNAVIVMRLANGDNAALPALAREIAQAGPAVIVADVPSAIKVAQSAAPGVPIVGAVMGSPVEQGLIQSFAHPGGNVTGIASGVEDLDAKLVELALEAIPNAKAMGLLLNPAGDNATIYQRELEAAARRRGISFRPAEARTPGEIDDALRALAAAGAGFVIVQPNGMLYLEMRHIATTALVLRLPTVNDRPEKNGTGIMLCYGVDYATNYARAAIFVDKILKGAKPADLPVEFPTKVELVVNLKTAKALDLVVPQSLLVAADEVIE